MLITLEELIHMFQTANIIPAASCPCLAGRLKTQMGRRATRRGKPWQSP